MTSPYGPTAGLSASQAISLRSSQDGDSQNSLYPPAPSDESQGSDSTTGASHLDQQMDAHDDSGASFINDASQPTPTGEFTPSASQDLAGLSPPGSLSASRIVRPPPGTYRERSGSATSHEAHPASRMSDSDVDDGVRTPTGRPSTPLRHPGTPAGLLDTDRSSGGPILPPPTLPVPESPCPSPHVPNSAGDQLTPGMDGMQASARPAVVSHHFLLGHRLYRIAKEGHPSLDWAVVRDASETTAVIPAGCLHHELPAGVNLSAGHVQFVLRGALLNKVTSLLSSFQGVRLFTVEIHHGRRRWVRIHFAVPEAMAAASGLSVDLEAMGDTPAFTLSSWEAGAPLGARYIAFRVDHSGMAPHAANRALLLAVRQTRCLHVIESWQVNHHDGRHGPSLPTHTLIALLYARPTRGGTAADALSVDERRAAPTFIGPNPTSYPGRFGQCSGAACRWPAQLAGDLHTRWECDNDKAGCAFCGRRNHTGRTCPTHLRQPPADAPQDGFPGSHDEDEDEYGYGPTGPGLAPTGPLPRTPYPLGIPAATPVVPVAGPSTGAFSTGAAPTRGSGRGRNRGSALSGRTHYQQMVLTPSGGFGPADSTAAASRDSRDRMPSSSVPSGPASPAPTIPTPSTLDLSGTPPGAAPATFPTPTLASPLSMRTLSTSLPSVSLSPPAESVTSSLPTSSVPPSSHASGSVDPSLTVVSLNCGGGGLRARVIESSSFSTSSLSAAHVLCLQECHSPRPLGPDDVRELQELLRVSRRPPFRAILGCDAGIIIRDPAITIDSHSTGDRWAFAILSGPPDLLGPAGRLAIWSIHGPFTTPAWDPIIAAVCTHTPPDCSVIFGADWNAVPDPLLDSLSGRDTAVPWSIPHRCLAPFAAVDLYRMLRPEGLAWTYARSWLRADGTQKFSARRLDSIWASPNLAPYLLSTRAFSCSSDHRAVSASFLFGAAPDSSAATLPRSRPWSLHPGVWNEPTFVTALESFAASYLDPFPPASVSPVHEWGLFHNRLRVVVKRLAHDAGLRQRSAQTSLEELRSQLDTLDLSSSADASRLPILLKRWRAALKASSTAESIRPAGTHTAAALRAGSWLFSAFASAASRSFPPLQTSAGLATTPVAKIAALTDFYRDLFSPRSVLPSYPSDPILASIRLRLPPLISASLNAPFTLADFGEALRAATRHSSAGPDGLPYRVYTTLAPLIGPRLVALLNALPTHGTWQVQARTILLPKAGDLSLLTNYRPITITDAYVRLLSRMLSARLLKVGDHLLPWFQAAFLPGRRSALVAGVLSALYDLSCFPPSQLRPPAFFIVSLDQSKAYDRVDRTWLFAVLREVGFPPSLLAILHSFYSSPVTRLAAMGGYGGSVPLRSGVLQGDPTSCLLYNLSLQPLFDLLSSRGVGLMVPGLGLLTALAFADDCLLFLEASSAGLSQLDTLLTCLRTYAQTSGSAVNYSKSSFWLVGTPDHTSFSAAEALAAGLVRAGLSAARSGGPASHLGHPLVHRASSTSDRFRLIHDRLSGLSRRAACFRRVGVDLLQRVQHCNRFLGARLWHSISVGPLPANFADLYFSAIKSYLLGPRPAFPPQSLTRHVFQGGFGLIDPDGMATALSISFLRRYLLPDDALGAWLRAGLTEYLAARHQLPPAALLLPTGVVLGTLRSRETRADGFFGRLTHALVSVDLGLSQTWGNLSAPALLTLPWITEATLSHVRPSGRPLLSRTKRQRLLSQRWLTWADILWRPVVSVPPRSHLPSHPLGPPPGPSAVLNGLQSRIYGSRATEGPALLPQWDAIWESLPPAAQRTLVAWGRTAPASSFGLPRDASPTQSRSWVPPIPDNKSTHFPWHLLTVFGHPLGKVSTASVRRRLLRAAGPVQPGWPFPSPLPNQPARVAVVWSSIWKSLAQLPLSSLVRSTNMLVLRRHVWVLSSLPFSPASSSLPVCPRLCGRPDGITHGFFHCAAAREVWRAALPLLLLSGCPPPPAFTEIHLLFRLDWAPSHLQPRLLLWRSMVLHTLYTLRHSAASRSRSLAVYPDFHFSAHTDVLSLVATHYAECLTAAWVSIQSRRDEFRHEAEQRFLRSWVMGGSFLRVRHGTISFASLSLLAAEPSFPPSSS